MVGVVLLHTPEAKFIGGSLFFLGGTASLEGPTFSWPMTGSIAELTRGYLFNRNLRGIKMQGVKIRIRIIVGVRVG